MAWCLVATSSLSWASPDNSFKPTPLSWRRPRAGATLARIHRPATGLLNSGVRPLGELTSLLINLLVALFAAVIANDWLLTRQISKAVESQRLESLYLTDFRSGGSLDGIVFNLFRLRRIPATHDLSDPDHIAILRNYRAHQFLIVLLSAFIVGFLFGT